MHVSQFNTSTCSLRAAAYGLPLAPGLPPAGKKVRGLGLADAVSSILQASQHAAKSYSAAMRTECC